jgi:hypothetical protein
VNGRRAGDQRCQSVFIFVEACEPTLLLEPAPGCAFIREYAPRRTARLSIQWSSVAKQGFARSRKNALVSATGLEFAYSQAPLFMQVLILAFCYLSITIGNLWVLVVNASARNESVISRVAETGLKENAFLMFFFAAFALVVALAFGWYARRYPMQDHYQTAGE